VDGLPDFNEIVVIDVEDSPLDSSYVPEIPVEVSPFSKLLEFNDVKEHIPPTPDSTAVILHTSEATSYPKGCVLTHKNILASSGAILQQVNPFTMDGVYLSYLLLATFLNLLFM
jgi:long-chain acyl-CoA synthetase